MGLICSILVVLPRELLQIAKYIVIYCKFYMIVAFLASFFSITMGVDPSFAQSCSAAGVQTINDNLAVPGRQGADALQFKFNSNDTIVCRPRFGSAVKTPANSVRISHCTQDSDMDLCFLMNSDGVLTSANIVGPGFAGGACTCRWCPSGFVCWNISHFSNS